MENIRIIIPRDAFTNSQSDTVECYQIIEEGPCVEESDTEDCIEIIEEGPSVADTEPRETVQTIEGPGICPLCSSKVGYFFVNFTEKLLMCENVTCEFPFGYQDLQFKKYEDTVDVSNKASTSTSQTIQDSGSQYPDSLTSSAVGFDIERIKNLNIEDFDISPKSKKQKSYPKTKESRIKKNLEEMEEFNKQLHEMAQPRHIITNQKWINKLKNLQDNSGLRLLKPYEMKNVVAKKDNELKLDIESGNDNNMCSIKVLMVLPSTSNV